MCVLPSELHNCFWEVDRATFQPRKYPRYTIRRILEHGNRRAVAWLQQTFSSDEIRAAIREERDLSPKSANFWGVVYGAPKDQIRALDDEVRNACPVWGQRVS